MLSLRLKVQVKFQIQVQNNVKRHLVKVKNNLKPTKMLFSHLTATSLDEFTSIHSI